MASQRLKRKALRNRVKSQLRTDRIKSLQAVPVMKRYTTEELKARFNNEEKVEEKVEVAAEVEVVEKKKAAPKAKKEEGAVEKKPAAKKKAAPKAKKEEGATEKKPAAKKKAAPKKDSAE